MAARAVIDLTIQQVDQNNEYTLSPQQTFIIPKQVQRTKGTMLSVLGTVGSGKTHLGYKIIGKKIKSEGPTNELNVYAENNFVLLDTPGSDAAVDYKTMTCQPGFLSSRQVQDDLYMETVLDIAPATIIVVDRLLASSISSIQQIALKKKKKPDTIVVYNLRGIKSKKEAIKFWMSVRKVFPPNNESDESQLYENDTPTDIKSVLWLYFRGLVDKRPDSNQTAEIRQVVYFDEQADWSEELNKLTIDLLDRWLQQDIHIAFTCPLLEKSLKNRISNLRKKPSDLKLNDLDDGSQVYTISISDIPQTDTEDDDVASVAASEPDVEIPLSNEVVDVRDVDFLPEHAVYEDSNRFTIDLNVSGVDLTTFKTSTPSSDRPGLKRLVISGFKKSPVPSNKSCESNKIEAGKFRLEFYVPERFDLFNMHRDVDFQVEGFRRLYFEPE